MATALLLVSFQSNYFKKKSNPKIKGIKKSARAAANLLEYFRENQLPIVHVLHTGKPEEFSAESLKPHEMLEPKNEESLVVTGSVNAFSDQKLDQILKNLEVDQLIIAGLTSENQILCTVLAAQELGYKCTVAQDACAATSLKPESGKIKAELVHKVVMAILANSGVEVSASKGYLKAEQKKIKKQKKEEAKLQAIQEAAKAAQLAVSEPKAEEIPAPQKKGSKKNNEQAKKEDLELSR